MLVYVLKVGMPGARLPTAGHHVARERSGVSSVAQVHPDGRRRTDSVGDTRGDS